MASPFKVFRKHQKLMIATLALMAMFAFVVLDIVADMMATREVRNPLVVTTAKYGDLNQAQVGNMLHHRRVLLGFLEQVAQAVALAGGNPFLVQMAQGGIGPATEEAVVETWLLANRAEELGLVVSDKTVNEFLRQLTTAQRISTEQVKQILTGLRLSQAQLFEILERELLALELRRLFQISLAGTTPAQRWNYYQRLNRKAAIEVLPIPVSQFVDDIPEPDEATLREFFEQYKGQAYVPGSPEPGFLEPHRIAVEYFKADYDKLDEIVEVRDEEVAQYYEENKDRDYRKEPLPEIDNGEPSPEESEGEPAEEAEQEGTPPSAEPEDEPDERPAKQQEEDATEASDVEADSEPSQPEGTSVHDKASRFHLAAFQQPEGSEDQDAARASPIGDEAVGPALGVAGDERQQEQPADEGPADAERPATAEDAAGPVEYVPLDEVKDEIRRRLAEAKVREVLGDLRDRMARYHDDWIVYNSLTDDEKKKATPPAKLDMAGLAKEYRLSAHRTELISAVEAELLDIGQSTLEGNVPFTQHAYETLPEYRPAMAQDDEGNYYLFWKVAETQERVPELEDPGVRERVLRAWKIDQARKPALAEAERLAAEARKTDQPLKELAGDDSGMQVVQAEPFSWVTYGAFPSLWARTPPRISRIKTRTKDPETGEESEQDAVEVPGDEFMRAVFSLEKGEVGVALNQPETTAYVFRVTDVNPLPEVLWRLFVAEDYSRYAMVANSDQRDTTRAWLDGIKVAVGFRWQRKPHP